MGKHKQREKLRNHHSVKSTPTREKVKK